MEATSEKKAEHKKFKFKLLEGHYATADTYETTVDKESGRTIPLIINGVAQIKERGKFYRQGEVFETDINLLAPPYHFPQNKPKFQLLSDPLDSMELDELEKRKQDIERQIAERKAAKEQESLQPLSTVDYKATYEQMDLTELKQLAIDNEVPLGKAKTREEIIKLLVEEDARAAKV